MKCSYLSVKKVSEYNIVCDTPCSQRSVRSIKQLASMKDEDRRSVLSLL